MSTLLIVALLTLVRLLHASRELVEFLDQLIEIGFELRQVTRLRLFHWVDPFMMCGMDVGWYIGLGAARFSMPTRTAEQFTANLTAYLTCLLAGVRLQAAV